MTDPAPLAASLRRRFETVDANIVVQGRSYALIKPRSVDELIDEEAFNRDERIPYWADVWPSARVLAERIATWNGAGRGLLELGCGLGFVATVAAAGGFRVVATDYYEEALDFARLHALLNGLPAPRTRIVDWRDWSGDLDRYDVVVGSDVLYEPAYSWLIAGALDRTLAADGEAWITDPCRRHAQSFPQACRERRLEAELQPVTVFREATVHQAVNTYRVRRQR